MKTHLLPKIISALLLLGMASVGSALQLQEAQVSSLQRDAKYSQQLLADNPQVSPSEVAAAIGDALGNQLNARAPQIAAAMVQYIIRGGVTPTTQQQAADVVATLASMLKGTPEEKSAALTAMGNAIAQVITSSGSPSSGTLAKAIVGTTATNLKFGSNADNATLTAFGNTFKTGNTALDTELANIVTQVNSGQAYTTLPTSTNVLNAANINTLSNNAVNPGTLVKDESNVLNKTIQ